MSFWTARAYDFYSEEFDQLQVPRKGRAHGTVQKIQVEMRGTCLRCARAKSRKRVTSATGKRLTTSAGPLHGQASGEPQG
jgi:hypothetical protein